MKRFAVLNLNVFLINILFVAYSFIVPYAKTKPEKRSENRNVLNDKIRY